MRADAGMRLDHMVEGQLGNVEISVHGPVAFLSRVARLAGEIMSEGIVMCGRPRFCKD